MEINVRLVGLLQRVNLSTSSVENMMELALDDGSKITSPISEADAEKLLHLSIGAAAPPSYDIGGDYPDCSRWEPSSFSVSPGVGEAAEHNEISDTIPPEAPFAIAPPAFPSTSYVREYSVHSPYKHLSIEGKELRHVPPVRTIPSDEAGNPIVPAVARAMARACITDEDGVPTA